jgi:uncharacterized membrane protein
MGISTKSNDQMIESKRKSFYKTCTWRVVATLTTFAIVFFVTKKPGPAVVASAFDAPIKTLIYYLHERFWSKAR